MKIYGRIGIFKKKLNLNVCYYFLTMSATNIYILKLKGAKYYVGKSDNPMKRYEKHLKGEGSAWTRKYKPIGVEKVIENQTSFDEDKWVKVYMQKHGIDNVRGGAYVLEELPEFQIDALKSEIWGSSDKCTTCGRSGHWAKDCYARTDVSGVPIGFESDNSEVNSDDEDCYECDYCGKLFDDCDYCEMHEKTCRNRNKKISRNACYRCGREGHYSSDCYAERHIKGYWLTE